MADDIRRIPIAGPWVTDLEVSYTADAARTAWYEGAGTYVRRFEQAFADRVACVHAASLPSATSAIHLALAAAGIGPGDEVIVPDLTWIASCAPVTYVGAEIVVADVEPDTWCLSVDAAEAAITDRTRAVIGVDLYGGMPDWVGLQALADRHDLFLLEDAAEALGSAFHGQPAGCFGGAAAFSFHGSKTLTTGEGGMLTTNQAALFDRVATLRDHGRPPGDRMFDNTEVAFKYKMSSLQAAFGLAQVERLDELVDKKRTIFRWYHDRLASDDRFRLNAEPDGTTNSYWMVTIVLDDALAIDAHDLMAAFDAECIDSRPMFRPLHRLAAFAGTSTADGAEGRNPVSTSFDHRGVNLPSALCLEERDVDRVVEVLRRAVDGH